MTYVTVAVLGALAVLQLLVGSHQVPEKQHVGEQQAASYVKSGGSRVQEDKDTSDKWIQLVSWNPRLFVYRNFLSTEECDHIKQLAAPFMKRSKVKGDIIVKSRTSYGTYLQRLLDSTITRIEERVSSWTHVPMVHQENIQVLRYSKGDMYGLHKDVRSDQESPRMSTVIMLLSDVEEGGETAFAVGSSYSRDDHPLRAEVKDSPNAQCSGQENVAVKLRKGDALLFHSLDPQGNFDRQSFHMGCPVHSGVKWAATIWIHTDPFEVEKFHEPLKEELPTDPGTCSDFYPECPEWAKAGKCDSDAEFMKGITDRVGPIGYCRASCGLCSPCNTGDDACYRRNRELSGFLNIDESELTQ